MAGFFCVWIERKFLGLGSGGKKISGFEIYGFVSRFDVCMEGLIFHVMFWVC